MSYLPQLKALGYVTGSPVTQRVFTVTNPAAGADWSFTCPGESALYVIAARAVLTTSAGVANRFPHFTVTNGSTEIARVSAHAPITAGLAVTVTALGNYPLADTALNNLTLNIGLPETILTPGYVLAPATGNIQAADQWSAITIWAVEHLTGEREHVRDKENAILDHARAIVALSQGDT